MSRPTGDGRRELTETESTRHSPEGYIEGLNLRPLPCEGNALPLS